MSQRMKAPVYLFLCLGEKSRPRRFLAAARPESVNTRGLANAIVCERGFILYRILAREDPWLDALRSDPEFSDLLQRSESRYRAAAAAFREAGGEQLLGVGPGPGISGQAP